MNAPTRTDHLTQPNVELLPLGAIALSETLAQKRRREEYNPAALDELAQSIAENGLMHPIVVRPLAALRGMAKYEVIAGERRYLAVQKLGQEHVLARILEANTEQVIRLQMVENLHRERLSTLAEAQGYKELVDGGVKAEAIADAIGKSRSYVYARIKLLELAPPVQEALKTGKLGADQALLFARIPSHKLQEVALNTLDKWSYQGHGEKLSFRRTAEILGDKAKGIFIPLAPVPWRLDDETFHTFGPKDRRGHQDPIFLPACTACPKRSGNDPELLTALDDPNICTDKECHDVKGKQTFERRRKEVQASGREVLTGEAAAAILPTDYATRGFVDLDSECGDDQCPEPEPRDADGKKLKWDHPDHEAWQERVDNYQPRTYRQILGDAVKELEITLVQDPKRKGRILELAPDSAVKKLLKEKGVTFTLRREPPPKPERPAKSDDPEAARRRAEKEAQERAEAELEQKVDQATDVAVLKAIHGKWKAPLKRDDLELVVESVRQESGYPNALDLIYPKPPAAATASEGELARWLVCWALTVQVGYESIGRNTAVKALCKRLKIDAKAIEKAIRAELAPKGDAPAKKPAKKKGGRK